MWARINASRRALTTLLAVAAVCGCEAPRSAPQEVEMVRTVAMACLQGRDVRSVLQAEAELAPVSAACADEIRAGTQDWGLDQGAEAAVLATLLAYRFAPYGESHAVTYEALLAEPVLDCDNYLLLAGYILERLRPGAGVVYVGFDGGPIGNHAQAFFVSDTAAVLLDPTVGVAAKVDFDTLLAGQPIEAVRVLRDARAPEAAVSQLHERVLASVQSGAYRPSHLLYYFATREDLLRFSEHTGPLWNGGTEELAYHFPTPGGAVLGARLRAQAAQRSQ